MRKDQVWRKRKNGTMELVEEIERLEEEDIEPAAKKQIKNQIINANNIEDLKTVVLDIVEKLEF